MSGPFDIWIDRRRDELMAYCRQWGSFLVAISNMGDLERPTPSNMEGGSWIPLPGVAPDKAAAFRNNSYTSLWVNPKYEEGYRDWFRVYLESIWGLDGNLLTNVHDVDHVYNKQRANDFGYAFVMAFPVVRGANRSHGSGYEAAMTDASHGKRAKSMRSIDTASLLKLHNALSPRVGGAFTPHQQVVIQQVAEALHISVAQVEQEIDAMMGRAYA